MQRNVDTVDSRRNGPHPSMRHDDDDSAVFCALHDHLASLGRHAQLTRCFSAVAELLVASMMRDACGR